MKLPHVAHIAKVYCMKHILKGAHTVNEDITLYNILGYNNIGMQK